MMTSHNNDNRNLLLALRASSTLPLSAHQIIHCVKVRVIDKEQHIMSKKFALQGFNNLMSGLKKSQMLLTDTVICKVNQLLQVLTVPEDNEEDDNDDK